MTMKHKVHSALASVVLASTFLLLAAALLHGTDFEASEAGLNNRERKVDLDVDANYDNEISIPAPDDPIEVDAGGVVCVGKRDEIIIRRVEPESWIVDVILEIEKGAPKINVFRTETGDTPILFNGTDNRFSGSEETKLYVQGEEVSDEPRDVELTLESDPPGGADAITYTVVKVEFDEADENTDNYGWDDYSMTAGWKFKSVEVGASDNVAAVVSPNGAYEMIAYASALPSCVSVAPDTASARDLIQVAGVSNGSSSIKAKAGGLEVAKFRTFAYTKLKKTVSVTRIHEAGGGWPSTVDISEAAIEAKLKKVFKQAVVEFEVRILPSKTVSFDLNPHDGVLDISSFNSAELNAIKNECETAYDYNIFLVGLTHPLHIGENPNGDIKGMMNPGQKFGFVFVSSAATLAHELGHGHGKLEHTFGPTWEERTWDDAENIMSYGDYSRWRLRRDQWDKCNPNVAE